MNKSLCTLFILSTVFVTGCATQASSEYAPEQLSGKFATDDCKFLGGLFKDQNLNDSLAVIDLDGGGGAASGTNSQKPKEKFRWPWDKGQEASASRDRASLRKTHKQKGCKP